MLPAENSMCARIGCNGLLPLYYHDDPDVCVSIAKAIYHAGVKVIEFTNRGERAVMNFSLLVRERDKHMPGLQLGVGTIKRAADAETFIRQGADFLVSPFFDKEIADFVLRNKKIWIPGCMTPAEIHQAQKTGFSLIKLFPGNSIGIAFVEAIMPLFPDIEFLVTGGVEATEENIAAWFKAGISAVGMGSKLITREIIANKKFDLLTRDISNLSKLITQYQSVQTASV